MGSPARSGARSRGAEPADHAARDFGRPSARRRRRAPAVAPRLARVLLRGAGALALGTVLVVLALRWVTPPTSAVILQRHAARLLDPGRPAPLHHAWVPWDAISPEVPIAVVAAEDQRFPTHHGFDLEAIRTAVAERGRVRMRGASTISQQVAKNLFLWSGRSWLRKGLEAYVTVLLEALWPKRRILEVYLNVAELGPSVFGIGAASTAFFRKPPAALTRREAALLAAALPDPARRRVDLPSAALRRRAAWIERQVELLGGPRYLAGLPSSI